MGKKKKKSKKRNSILKGIKSALKEVDKIRNGDKPKNSLEDLLKNI